MRLFSTSSELRIAEQPRRAITNSLWELTLARSNGETNAISADAAASVVEFSFNSGLSDRERDVYQKLDRLGYLTPPEPGSDIPLVRWLGSTFEPAVFHIGKTSVSCTLVSAIKNHNPLCLLNPFFLTVSW